MAAAPDTDIRKSAGALPDPVRRDVPGSAKTAERLLWLDAARTAALFAMIVFHLVRDLEFFGAIPVGTTAQGGWALFARLIAGSFLLLSGVSLVIAHEHRFRLQAWAQRLALIFAAAALVSVATYLAFPERFIFFGILHCIALSGLLGACLLWSPMWALWAIAACIIMAGGFWDDAAFNSPWLAWTGLSSVVHPSLDFVPLVPWFAFFVAGMALAKGLPLSRWDLFVSRGDRLGWLTWPGRHSLAIYLAHQPVLISILWLIFSMAG